MSWSTATGSPGVTPQPEQAFSLAAGPEADALRLELIDRATGTGATWAVIGRALGMSGREAKRHAHRLRGRVKRASLLAAGEEG